MTGESWDTILSCSGLKQADDDRIMVTNVILYGTMRLITPYNYIFVFKPRSLWGGNTCCKRDFVGKAAMFTIQLFVLLKKFTKVIFE